MGTKLCTGEFRFDDILSFKLIIFLTLRYESVAWIPNVVAFITILAVGGKHLQPSKIPEYPVPSASTVISFATFIASSVISWCTMVPDYGVYHNEKASR